MASTKSWKSSIASKFLLFKKNSVESAPSSKAQPEFAIPTHLQCPITLDVMKDPVTLSTGITYDRQSIETWIELGNTTCPVTKQALKHNEELLPNHVLRKMIQDWCVVNRSFGVERIPTPKIPVTSFQASELLSEIASASSHRDHLLCSELVRKLKTVAKESEKNRRTITMSGAARVLAASLLDLSSDQQESNVNSGILSALTLFPLDDGACEYISSPKSLKTIVSVLNSGDLTGRLNAVLVLKELLASSNSDRIGSVAMTEGLVEALVKMVERPISPQATKASLVDIFYLCSSSEKITGKFVSMGIVSMLLEILVDCDKSTTEKALAVLNATFSTKSGAVEAGKNALTVPVLVKKMIRVSDMATEFAVSALWKLCKSSMGAACLNEALQLGVFDKLLLLLQVGCKVTTKNKVSELLKLSKGLRGDSECVETGDFKGLKRSF